MSIYRTTYLVEVFHHGEDPPFMDDDSMSDLASIDDAITEGPCIGTVTAQGSEEVDPTDLKSELIRIGNDGTFFDEDGLGIDADVPVKMKYH